jgi:hypothetical protein
VNLPIFHPNASLDRLAWATCLALGQLHRHVSAMLNILSGFIGLVTLILMIPAVLPLLGALNWILVPMALFGAFIGLMSSKKGGQYFCLIVAAFGALRLFMGGGII